MKRLFRFVIIAITIFCVMVPFPAFAATTSYQSTPYEYDVDGYVASVREKIGGYYIWVEDITNSKNVCIGSRLLLSKDGETIKKIKTVSSTERHIDPTVITNGNMIYYAVESNGTATIYKTSRTGKTHTKIKTVKRFGGLAAYYNGKIYYSQATNEYGYAFNLYSYSVKTKKNSLVQKKFLANSQYGRYIIGATSKAFDISNTGRCIIDLKTGKKNTLPEAKQATTNGKKVYYWKYTSYETMERAVYECSLKGQNIKKIQTLSCGGYPLYFGRSISLFESDQEIVKIIHC